MEISQFSTSRIQTSRQLNTKHKRSNSSALLNYKQPIYRSSTSRDSHSPTKVSNIFRITAPVFQSLTRTNSEQLSNLHTPSRKSYKFTLTKQPISDLKQRQKEISNFLGSINQVRKKSTARLIIKNAKVNQACTDRRDSFRNRYDPSKNLFTHDLIGQVPLPRKVFSFVRSESELEILKQVSITDTYHAKLIKFEAPVLDLFKKHTESNIEDIKRRAMTALKHMLMIHINPALLSKLSMLIPKQPFGLPKSHKFLNVCKEGSLKKVKKLLEENPWLAHTFDSSKETGMHWAAKRNFCGIMRALVSAGAWVDSRDLVGRSALFIATRAGFVDGVRLLIEFNANPFIKTYAGSSISSVATHQKVKILIIRAKIVISILEALRQEI